MLAVLARAQARLDAFQRRPLFAFLDDRAIAPAQRLAFAPALAHFVLSFADLCRLVLRHEPAGDRYQTLVNTHADEDGDHWRWYLGDLEKLGHDRAERFSDVTRQLWGPANEKCRLLTYRLCRHGWGAPSLQKLLLITIMEATAGFGLARTARVAREWHERGGPELVYFGTHHVTVEREHTLGSDDVQALLREVTLDDATRRQLGLVVDDAFDAFTDLVDELFRAAAPQAV